MKVYTDKTSPADSPPLIMITGEVGIGKTTAVGKAYPDYLWLQNRQSGLRTLDRWIRDNPKLAEQNEIRLPNRRVTKVNLNRRGRAGNVHWGDWWIEFLCWFSGKAKDDPESFPGLVIDEGSVFAEWIQASYKEQFGTAGRAMFDTIDSTKEAVEFATQVARANNFGLIWISHWQNKTYISGENKSERRRGSPGDVLYPAGPTMPIGTMIRRVTRWFDAVWQVALQPCDDLDRGGEENEEQRQRILITTPEEDVIRKAGGFGIPPIIPISSHLEREQFREIAARISLAKG